MDVNKDTPDVLESITDNGLQDDWEEQERAARMDWLARLSGVRCREDVTESKMSVYHPNVMDDDSDDGRYIVAKDGAMWREDINHRRRD